MLDFQCVNVVLHPDVIASGTHNLFISLSLILSGNRPRTLKTVSKTTDSIGIIASQNNTSFKKIKNPKKTHFLKFLTDVDVPKFNMFDM